MLSYREPWATLGSRRACHCRGRAARKAAGLARTEHRATFAPGERAGPERWSGKGCSSDTKRVRGSCRRSAVEMLSRLPDASFRPRRARSDDVGESAPFAGGDGENVRRTGGRAPRVTDSRFAPHRRRRWRSNEGTGVFARIRAGLRQRVAIVAKQQARPPGDRDEAPWTCCVVGRVGCQRRVPLRRRARPCAGRRQRRRWEHVGWWRHRREIWRRLGRDGR
jgi:hypothetical protein